MLSSRAIRTWSWLHTYSSLVCTAFMLLLCLTGLPLIFQHEIAHWTGDVAELPIIQYSGKPASLDAILAAARARYPERIVQYASADEEQPLLWYVTLTPTPAATTNYKSIAVDGRTALVLHDFPTNQGFMYWMFRLHVDLFAGLPGMLFLGCMGLLLVIAIVSGLVLYSPFMRKLEFGEVRRKRSKNIKWLDLHNLLGIVTLVWALAVASTGVVNATADLLVGYWQHTHISNLLKPYKSQPVVLESERAPMQAILKAANSAKPGMQLVFAAFPGTDFSSPHHVTVYLRGTTPLW